MLTQELLSKAQTVISAYPSNSQASDSQTTDDPPSLALKKEFLKKDQLDQFWSFVYERQRIWYLRTVMKGPPPWTRDPILQAYRFTNVYRECDPGTEYLIHKILQSHHSDEDKIFNVMLYRLIGRKETYERIGFQSVETFDSNRLKTTLQYIRDIEKRSPFSGAYTVCSYSGLGSHDKTENVAQVFANLRQKFPSLYERILASDSARAVYEELNRVYGFGKFLAYQVLVDLLYPLKVKDGKPLLPFSHDEWAIAGPGASLGIRILLKHGVAASELEVMRWLRHHQREEFGRLRLDFHYRKNSLGRPIELTLANIQNCLCEFYKYHKIKTGTGRARRKFVPRTYLPLGQELLEAPV